MVAHAILVSPQSQLDFDLGFGLGLGYWSWCVSGPFQLVSHPNVSRKTSSLLLVTSLS